MFSTPITDGQDGAFVPHESFGPDGAPGPHEPGAAWVDVRRDERATWIVFWIFLVLFTGIPMGVTAVPAYGVVTGESGGNAKAAASVFVAFAGLMLLLAVLLLCIAPRYLARQGVEVGERGVGVRRHAKWWLDGRDAFISWDDVLEVTRGTRTGGSPRRTLELHLRQADDAMPLPSWAVLVPAGEEKWGTTAPRPRLVFDTDRDTLDGLMQAIEEARPELTEDLARRAQTGEEQLPSSVTQRAPRAMPGHPNWVDMRWQGVKGWIVAVALCGYLAVGLAVVAVVVGVTVGDLVPTLSLGGLAIAQGLITWPVARMGPRYSTKQGLLADGDGITLVQEPKRWFTGRSVHIPWSQVREIGQDVVVASNGNGQSARYFIDIRLRDPLRDVQVPTWTEPAEDGVRIRAGKAKRDEIVRALRAPRPDLFPGA